MDTLPYPPSIIQDCNIEVAWNRWLQEYLEYLAEIFTDGIIVNKWLEKRLKKWGKFDATDEAPMILIRDAFLDIYALQIIWIHYWISDGILKGIIYKNMVFGNWLWISWIAYLIKQHTHPINWKIDDVEKLIKLLKGNKWTWTKKRPVCPFAESQIRQEWIDEIYGFIKDVIIPVMQQYYWNSSYTWERFWSWKKIWTQYKRLWLISQSFYYFSWKT